MKPNQSFAPRLYYLLVRRRVLVAIALWFLFALIYANDLAYHLRIEGAALTQDWIWLLAFVIQPILIAVLAYIALRSLAREERARRLYQSILADAPVGIMTTDSDGTITSANPLLLRLMNAPDPTTLLGHNMTEFHGAVSAPLEDALQRCRDRQPFSLLDFEFPSPSGVPYFVSAHGAPLHAADGGYMGMLVLIEDGSERRRWRAELQARTSEAQRRTRELEMLRDISNAISSTLDLDEILRLAYERISKLMDASTFFIALYDDFKQELDFEFLVDNGVLSPKTTRPLTNLGGLSGWIIENKKPLLIGDLQNPGAAPVSPGVIGSPTRSWLGVPLIARDHVIGVMSVQSYAPDVFDQAHLNLLDSLANQISIAIENARLFSETRVRAQEVATANDIARAINSTLNLDEVLQLFFARITVLFNVEAGTLVLIDPNTDELVFEVVHGGAGESLLHKRMPRDTGIVGWVTRNGQPLLVPDVRQDPRWYQDIDRDTRFVTRSILATPIKVEDRAIGAVELINRRDGSLFTEADEKLLGMFAASASIAIENARLHRQTEKRLAEVTTYNVISHQLATSLDLDEILNSITARLQLIFSSRLCAIHLLRGDSRTLSLGAISGPDQDRSFSEIPIGVGVVGRAALGHDLVYVETARELDSAEMLDRTIQSVLSVPLVTHDRILGTITLASETAHAFSGEDVRLLTTVASQIATSVENAQLYADLKERAESLKKAYDELKELDRLKTEFIQNVSHELRTPLTFIKGYIQLLVAETFGPMPKEALAGLETAGQKTDVLIRLVNDILQLQQADALGIRLAPVNVEMIARASVRGAWFVANQSNVQLTEDISPDLPQIVGDSERLSQVFENLIQNAIKFSPNGGTVCVHVSPDQDGLRIDVEDHGIGIAADQMSKVFTRFYQVDGSITRRYGGTGLGLSIVKQIVDAHQGRIWVTSELGKGSTFSVYLPCGLSRLES